MCRANGPRARITQRETGQVETTNFYQVEGDSKINPVAEMEMDEPAYDVIPVCKTLSLLQFVIIIFSSNLIHVYIMRKWEWHAQNCTNIYACHDIVSDPVWILDMTYDIVSLSCKLHRPFSFASAS